MSKRRILSEKEIEFNANLSDSEWSDISMGESDDFIPGYLVNQFPIILLMNMMMGQYKTIIMAGLIKKMIRLILVSTKTNWLKIDDIFIQQLVTLFFFRRLFEFFGWSDQYVCIVRNQQAKTTSKGKPSFHLDWYECQNLCIDESMILWRGRLFFHQYIKNKKDK